jgi:phosphate-selective porin
VTNAPNHSSLLEQFMLRTASRALLAISALGIPLAATAVAQSADNTTVDVAILDVLKARGIIDQGQYDELLALARDKAAAASSEVDLIEGRLERLRAPDVTVNGGQPGKLDFRSSDGKWSLKMQGKVQARVENYNSDTDSGDGTNFSVPRAYLNLEGTAGAPPATYKFEFDVPTQSAFSTTSTTQNPRLRDAYISWAFVPLAALRFGQFKVPYGREELTSTFALSIMERSIASTEFAPVATCSTSRSPS